MSTMTFAYILAFGAIVFSLVVMEANEKPLAIHWSFMLLLGEASYSLYLVHQQYGLQFSVQVFGRTTPVLALVWGIIFTISISIGLYKLIEQPTRRLLNHYLVSMQPSITRIFSRVLGV